MLFSHTQSIFAALLLFCIGSRYQFGFELNSIFVQGIYGQLFGMVLMPIIGKDNFIFKIKKYFNLKQRSSIFYFNTNRNNNLGVT